ncbi:MAG: hypothetical protein KDD19_29235 [Phaeodactylibacter sp.]|nr:hypothetical protein [Phaeodactylibacter sp.]MCB9052178.1 hypothetical protein [Lewinellaceae bacterium]
MQFRLFFGLLAVILTIPLFAQPVMRTNEKGETIIVFPDGTTQVFSEFSGTTEGQDTESQKYPVSDIRIAPLEGSIPITEEDLRRIAERKSQIAKDAARIAQERVDESSRQRTRLEEEYRQARQRNASPSLVEQLATRVESARQAEADALRESRIALAEVSNAESITRRGNYVEEYIKQQELKKQQAKQYENLRLTAGASYENLLLDDNYSPFTSSDNVILNPPTPPCQAAYEGKDSRGRFRRDLQKQLLFTHTDDRMRAVLKGQEYLTCNGYFTQLGGFRFLTLEFTFAYPNAREAYGFIEKGSYLMIKLLNGQFVTLFSGKMDKGTYDTETELLSYLVHYPIDQSQLNILKNSEVDSVIVSWSSGYEEYQVYQLGFFINQIRCLE